MGLSLAQQTIQRVSAGLESGEAAGLSEIVELIQQLSGHALDTSVQELASLIGKDLIVTAKVIKAANTMGYNPSGVAVSTITQAIHVIGFNKIRQLAVSLLLIENAERTLNAQEKREIAALALCSGLMAETVMEKHGTTAPEQAFICASLRNYGRILMTTFMIDEYRQARTLAADGVSEDQAFQQIFGLTPLELGHHLLASAHLPDAILKSLQTLPPDAVRRASQSSDMELLLLAELSVKLCELALRPDVNAEEFERAAGQLSMRAGRAFGLDVDGMLGLLRETGAQLTTFANTFGLTAITGSIAPRIKARISREDPVGFTSFGRILTGSSAQPEPETTASPAAAAPAPNVAPTTPPPVAATVPSKAPASNLPTTSATAANAPIPAAPTEPPPSGEVVFQRAFDAGIEIMAGLLDDNPINMDKVFRVVLDAALQGFGAAEGIVFVRERSSHAYAAQFGTGSLYDTIRRKPLVRESDRNVCGISLQRMEDVFISDATDAKIQLHLPAWLRASKLPSFVILPVHESKRPFALLLAGWSEKKTMGFTVSQIRQIRSMLKLVGTARRLAGD